MGAECDAGPPQLKLTHLVGALDGVSEEVSGARGFHGWGIRYGINICGLTVYESMRL